MKTDVIFIVEDVLKHDAMSWMSFNTYGEAEAAARAYPGVYEIHKRYINKPEADHE
ncbi:hypothetical protein [Bifidobacterium sp. SO1]|uniref:hypothetical protein n=1 Tax=Bifidobacterium sp. SO1 TaxID=2809029 RepID=UPI001BDC7960|nr:hypothetical protein [Bifidobacterium sp. SO1]MBT1161269.1 hypothetical protein [Bifidobacterium sp. SO1]